MEEKTMTPAPIKKRKVKGRVEIEVQRCKACELCTVECNEEALSLGDAINGKGYRYIVVNNDLCTGCMNCALVCPDGAITVYRTHVRKQSKITTDVRDELKGNLIGSL